MEKSLVSLAKMLHEQSVKSGWWSDENGQETDRNFGELCMLVVCEIAEAFEEYRHGRPLHYYEGDSEKPEGIAVELVDAIIRLFDMMAQMGVDIDAILTEKHLYNTGRPYRHGNLKA